MDSNLPSDQSWLASAIDGFYHVPPFEQLGFVLTVLGFAITGITALATFLTARKIRAQISLVGNISDISKVLAIIEEIRRLIRGGFWAVLPDRYTELRHLLVAVKNSSDDFTQEQISNLEKAITDAQDLEEKISQKWASGLTPKEAAVAANTLQKHADKMNALSIQTKKKVK